MVILFSSTFPDSIPYTPLHSPSVPESCTCGCTMEEDSGEIIASGRCSQTSTWLISLPARHTIKLRFNFINLYENKQWVRVRNGGTSGSDLIAFSDGRRQIDHVTSTSNQMLVEFFTESDDKTNTTYSRVPTKPIHVYGFIATYTSNCK